MSPGKLDLDEYALGLGRRAKEAAAELSTVLSAKKDAALLAAARLIRSSAKELQAENARDLDAGRKVDLSAAMLDRLELTASRIEGMAAGLEAVVALRDPVGETLSGWRRPNGLSIEKVRVPLGVILMIYESRPNVTADAAALTLKSGNAVILRGGKEAIHSNLAIGGILRQAIRGEGLPGGSVQVVETADRALLGRLLKMKDHIDLVIPRGGKGLIERVTTESLIPVIKHYEGICHTYVDGAADLEMATEVCANAKVQRPGVCNAMETMLVHEAVAEGFLPMIAARLGEAGVEMRGDEAAREIIPGMGMAAVEDWSTEYLDLILSIKVVKNVDEAIGHIRRYGSGHSDAIVSGEIAAVRKFVDEVDSSAVFVNASTRFNDGGEFGFGAEIGISTDKIHARGPMALPELTSYKYVVWGDGQVRR